MENHNDMIHDEELRVMLNRILLDESDADLQDQHLLLDMEATIVMNCEPHFGVPFNGEQAMLKKLQQGHNGLMWWKQLLIGIGTLMTVGLIWLYWSQPSSPHVNQQKPVPVNHPQVKTEHKEPLVSHASSPEAESSKPLAKPSPQQQPPQVPALMVPVDTLPPIQPLADPIMESAVVQKTDQPQQFMVDTLFAGVKSLTVEGLHFPVNVKGMQTSDVHLKADFHVEGTSRSVKKIAFHAEYERKGEALTITIVRDGPKNLISTGSIRFIGFVDLIVPREVRLDIRNDGGEIRAENLAGERCNLNSKYGSVYARNLECNPVIRSSSGNVSIEQVNGSCNLHAAYGNINAAAVKGALHAFAGSGNIVAEDIAGNSQLESTYGNVSILRLEGDLDIKATSGNISVDKMNGKFLSLKADYGKVKAQKCAASLTVKSSSGDVSIRSHAGNIIVDASYGNVEIEESSGNYDIESSSGSVQLSRVTGNGQIASSYGDVVLEECSTSTNIRAQSGDVKLRRTEIRDSATVNSNYGHIVMQFAAPSDQYSFDLNTHYGKIQRAEWMEAAENKDKTAYYLQKGNKWIRATTNSGDVTIR